MAQQTIDATDTLDAGRQKINSNFTETYSDASAASASASAAQSNIDTHEALTNNPHSVTKLQVGLGNADDTSDQNKPVSDATQLALDTVTKVLITGTTVFDDTAFGKIHICSGTSADYTITLPTAVGNEGKMICIKGDPDITILSKVVTIDGSGTEKIDNSLTQAIASAGYLTVIARVTSGVGHWDIISFNQGAWIPWTIVWTGFSSDPTGVQAKSVKSGKTCSFNMTLSGYGTSNATTQTVTLPYAASASYAQQMLIMSVTTSSVLAVGKLVTQVGSNVATCYISVSSATWVASGTKAVIISGTYEIL